MPPPTIAKLLVAAKPVLRLIPWNGEDDAAYRTTHSFTLGQRLNELSAVVDGWKAKMTCDKRAALQLAGPT